MRFIHFRTVCLFAAMILFAVPSARAAYTITIDQVGPDVVATGSGGSLDITNLIPLTSSGNFVGGINPQTHYMVVGTGAFTFYALAAGPDSFGPGSKLDANTTTGGLVGVDGVGLFVPNGYLPGVPLGISTSTFANQTISSMGLIPGTYTYTWGTAPHADSLTVQIVPEPASLSLLALAGLTLRRRRA